MDKHVYLSEGENRKNRFLLIGAEGEKKGNVVQDKEQFIKKTFENDPKKGIELLFKAYYRPLCSHAARYVYSKELAEDLVIEVFEKFVKRQLHQQVTTSFQAYLFTTVRHQALQYLRSEFSKKRFIALEGLSLESLSPTPQQLLQYDELYLEIERTIKLLTPSIQKVFLMSRFEGKKNAVIADELQISIKTVEAHITKVLKLLRKVLQQQFINVLLVVLYFLSSH